MARIGYDAWRGRRREQYNGPRVFWLLLQAFFFFAQATALRAGDAPVATRMSDWHPGITCRDMPTPLRICNNIPSLASTRHHVADPLVVGSSGKRYVTPRIIE
jgi:hypothetical protein